MKRTTSIQLVSKAISVLCILNFLVTALGYSSVPIAVAQEGTSEPAETNQLSQTLQDDGATIVYDEQSGLAQFISFEDKALSLAQVDPSLSTASAEAAARGFLSVYGNLFGLTGQADELAVKDGSPEADANYVRFQQSYQGVPILGGELIVALDGGKNIKSALGEVTPNLAIATSPAIDASTAATTAITAVAKWNSVDASTLTASDPELWIYDPSLMGPDGGPVVLVWRTEVSSTDLSPIRELVLVNAQQGGIALHFNQIDSFEGPYQSQDEIPTEIPTEAATETPTEAVEPTETPTPEPTFENTPLPESIEETNPQLGALAATWYVAPSPTGNDSNSCADPGAACATINSAIAKAADGDTIKVMIGTYAPHVQEIMLINKDLLITGGWNADFTLQTDNSVLDLWARGIGIYASDVVATVEHFDFQGSSGWGAVYNKGNLTLNFVNLRANVGFGIQNEGGTIVFSDGEITYNTGYALFNQTATSGSVQINRSLIAYNLGALVNRSNLEVNASTITLNHASMDGGGAIYNSGTAAVNNSTITQNFSGDYGGGIHNEGGTFTISNSIVADNIAELGGVDCKGAITSGGYNLIGNAYECNFAATTGDLVGTDLAPIDPRLSPLQDNGGVSLTRALLTDSPAVEAGNPATPGTSVSTCSVNDQAGNARPIGSVCDIGAFEGSIGGIFGWYVAPAPLGNDTNSCSAADSPCETIMGALGKTGRGDTIYVAQGTYTDTGPEVVAIDKETRLSGGWDSLFQSQTGLSVIDGQHARRGIKDYYLYLPAGEFTHPYLILDHFEVTNGIGEDGGGISVGGALILLNSVVSNNTAARGGGIYFSGGLFIKNSLIVGNSAGSGGGLYRYSGPFRIDNSTISSNWAGEGGGFYLEGLGIYGPSTWNNVTVAGNFARSSGGAIYSNSSNWTIGNSIIARNTSAAGANCVGTFGSTGYNVRSSCSGLTSTTGDKSVTTVALAALQNNGGPTPTHGLLIGSVAINSGNSLAPGGNLPACLIGDQRDSVRPVDGRCDSGAFEGSISGLPMPVILTYSASNNSNLPGTFLCNQGRVECTNGVNPDADKAHLYTLDTYNYYATNFGRDGIDNAGMTIISSVDVCLQTSCPYDNASWNGTQMVYGGGNSTTDSLGYSQADDVVGHELTHGVTQYESHLFYYYQSGAINEALSDIFGEFVDQTNGHGNDSEAVKWMLGEDLPTGANRDMENPPAFDQPDKMSSPDYIEDSCHPSQERPYCDSGYVHTNSGVANKAAYLMAQGGTFNGRTVTPLGLTKTAAIWYEVQTNLLTSGADYLDLNYALNQACLNLIGGSTGITGADCAEVMDAIKAVEMDQQPVANYNPEAPFCSGSLVPNNVFFDTLENGSGNWTFNNDSTTRWQLDMPTTYGAYAYSGLHYLFGNDTPPAISDTHVVMTNGVLIPANAYMHFAHAYGFEQDGSNYYDGGVLEYSSNGGNWTDASSLIDTNGYRGTISGQYNNPLKNRQAFVGDSHGYISTRLNLSSKAGQNLRFRWRMGLDSVVVDWGWWVDNVRIYTCVAPIHKPSDFDGDGKADPALYYNNGEWRWFTSSTGFFTQVTSTAFNITSPATPQLGNDFDGDGKTDPTMYYNDWGQIYWRLSSTNAQGTFGYFTATAHPVPIAANDYDGDRKSDPALFYPTNGVWSWKNSSNNSSGTAAFNPAGNPTPIANADLNGDGKSDPALYYSGTGLFAWNANGTVGTAAFNPDGNPTPFLADFDGDGKSDPALYYRIWALWAWKRSSDGQMSTAAFNPAGGPQPVVGFFDSDNKADAGLYYADLGLWAWKRTTDGGIGTAAYNPGGSPEPQFGNDFDGDGKADPALYYRAWGLWAWKRSSDGQAGLAPYGPNGNPAVIGGLDFDGDGKTDPGLYYRDYGLWAWQKSTDGTIITKTMTSSGSPQPVR